MWSYDLQPGRFPYLDLSFLSTVGNPAALLEVGMFSVREKRMISDAVQTVLRSTHHPELPECEIAFRLQVQGAGEMSWADIRNNGAVKTPSVNPHNEAQDGGGQ